VAVRTKTLATGTLTGDGSTHTLFTVPSGKTVIVKDIRIWAGYGANGVCRIQVASGPAVSVIDQGLAYLDVLKVEGFIVLEPGDEMTGLATTNDLRYHISGAELDGVA